MTIALSAPGQGKCTTGLHSLLSTLFSERGFIFALQELAARQIAAVCNASDDKGPKIIVEKSTVPVKTADAMAQVMAASCKGTDFQAFAALKRTLPSISVARAHLLALLQSGGDIAKL